MVESEWGNVGVGCVGVGVVIVVGLVVAGLVGVGLVGVGIGAGLDSSSLPSGSSLTSGRVVS